MCDKGWEFENGKLRNYDEIIPKTTVDVSQIDNNIQIRFNNIKQIDEYTFYAIPKDEEYSGYNKRRSLQLQMELSKLSISVHINDNQYNTSGDMIASISDVKSKYKIHMSTELSNELKEKIQLINSFK